MAKIIGEDSSAGEVKSCRGCGALVKYFEKDIKTRNGRFMGEDTGEEYVECPRCKHKIILRSW